jgi:anaerobic magnesium-protoporphyrin IX monomethyl ester cyclase
MQSPGTELFLFVRPPRPLWPFNGPSSAFWPPLAFASLAASLRRELRDLRVEILDAPAMEMGWRTLESELRRRRPAYVGIGEEAVSCVEGLRLAHGAKAVGAAVIAGGCFFGHAAPEALQTGCIDVVVHGEGERTVVELVEALRATSPDPLSRVPGISYTREGQVIPTAPREPIADLDALPFPAYDLLPVERYGARSRNHPQLAAIELGRGCYGSCDFCVLWRQMGRFVGGQVRPHYRVKSVERLLEEIRVLVRHHRRRYLGWVDPCFNAHPTVPGELAERLLHAGMVIPQSAWVRTDALVRDAASGALESCVRAGLNEVYLGLERPEDQGLATLGKTCTVADAREALRILQRRFPEVLTVGSFIYGLPGDTPSMIRATLRFAFDLGLDQFFFVPLTPLPGTTGWRPELWDPTGNRFRAFSFLPGAQLAGAHARLERTLARALLLDWPRRRVAVWARALLGRGARRRRVTWRLMVRGVRFQLGRIWSRWRGLRDDFGLVFPSWYES